MIRQRLFFYLLTAALTAGFRYGVSGQGTDTAILDAFSLDGSRNIMNEDGFGIMNGRLTFRVNYRDVGTVSGLYAPPYASSDFLMEIRFFGEKVPTMDRYKWYPNEVDRKGRIHGVEISTETLLVAEKRAGVMVITLYNTTGEDQVVPVQFNIKGGLDYVSAWGFARPDARKATHAVANANSLIRENDAGRISVSTDIPDLTWFDPASHWNTAITLPAGTCKSYYVAIGIGNKEDPAADCSDILHNPKKIVKEARETCASQLKEIFSGLPRFRASNKQLEAFYNRSLVNLYMTRWEVPEFILHPYYGSGAVVGGCVANYIWEFGIPAKIFPLYDPRSAREHIKKFMQIDINRHHRLEPMTGKGDGEWYPINQEKIIGLIYYYVLHTGDRLFLNEEVNGETVLDYALRCAFFGDDTTRPVRLYDYGKEGENHLELRRGYPYRGIIPDLNGRRYHNYLRVYSLTRLAGSPLPVLITRARALKKILKDQLWNAGEKWFDFQVKDEKEIRWTNIMFMLIGSGVLDKEEEEGLISHLNHREFLGDYGMHSISKLDPAYDQVDIDHGGGGSYNAFPPMICERLYNTGYAAKADQLLRSILWWGERMPYWGDSFAANYMGYREDTPLQSDFSSMAGAQCIIFGMFGIQVHANGDITVNPHAPSFSPEISIRGLRLLGSVLDVTVQGTGFSVKAGDRTYRSPIGKPITFNLSK